MKYPNGIKSKKQNETHNIVYSNRGMSLEKDLNSSNQYYRDQNIAYIYKKPTPIKLVKVDYKIGKITEAYFDMPSTTDYNGIYQGKYIDFEAKETINKKQFPLRNIHKHQIEHIKNIVKEKGICFIIVRFTSLNKTYLLMGKDLIDCLDNNTKSSIPITYFIQKGYLIQDEYIPRVNYLKIIEKMEENNEKEN